MSSELRNRLRHRGEHIHAAFDHTIVASGMLIGTLLTLLILYLGVQSMSR